MIIKKAAEDKNLTIPYPIRTLDFDENIKDKLTDTSLKSN